MSDPITTDATEDDWIDDAGLAHRYARVNGVRLHYVIAGAGPAVVLLHGWPVTWAEWRPLIPRLAEGGHTVIAPDLRGMGDSDKPLDGYTKTTVADDVHELVTGLGFDRIDLVGTDIGMMVAYAYAAAHPDEVDHLVLGEALLPGFGLEELMNPATGGYWHFGFHMQVDLAEMLTEDREEAYLAPMWRLFSPAGGIDDATAAEFLQAYRAPGAMRAGFQHYAALLDDGRENRERFAGKLTMPVLVLNGDQGIPQHQTLDGVRRVAERVDARIVPRSGHAIGSDNPHWVAAALLQFFNDPAADNTGR